MRPRRISSPPIQATDGNRDVPYTSGAMQLAYPQGGQRSLIGVRQTSQEDPLNLVEAVRQKNSPEQRYAEQASIIQSTCLEAAHD